jgi:Tfp pilus tip-associated adhesin PilY1
MPCANAAVTVKDIYLNNELVNENVLLGTPVGEFTALKQEDSPTPPPLKYIFTLVDDPDASGNFAFKIDGSTLKTAANLDNEITYKIKVRAQNPDLPDDFFEKFFTITAIDSNPTASFTPSATSGDEPLQVDFIDRSESHDGIVSWSWDFGNGTTSSVQHPQGIVFEQDGTYTVSLTITEADGDTNVATQNITVSDTGPTAAFQADKTTGAEPLTVNFFNQSTSYDGITSCVWNFGDGNTITTTGASNQTHEYLVQGTYSVTLEISEADGNLHSASTTITVADADPDVDFLVSPTTGVGPLTVTFQDKSIVYDDDTVWYGWDFGDGSSSNQKDTTHTYAAVAEATNYSASLTIQDADGSTITKTVQIKLLPDVDDPDNDNDGWTVGMGDCNDADANINPGTQEICGDGIDNDCFDGDCDETGACTDLADKPLDVILNAAPPNIMFVIDDSESMDYELMTPEGDGKLWIGESASYLYLFNTADNLTTNSSPVLGYDEHGAATAERRIARARWHGFNAMYYNPAYEYEPWYGEGAANKQNPKLHPTKDPEKNPTEYPASQFTFDLSQACYTVELAVSGAGGEANSVWVDDQDGDSVFKVSKEDDWGTNAAADGAHENQHRYASKKNASATWYYTIPSDGDYQISVFVRPHQDNDTQAGYTVKIGNTITSMTMPQNGLQLLGTYTGLSAGTAVEVTVKRQNDDEGINGLWTIADAILFLPVDSQAVAIINEAHYWTGVDTDADGMMDDGESYYLVNFVDTDSDGDLDSREFYRFVDGDTDVEDEGYRRVDDTELVLLHETGMPDALVQRNFEEDLQNFANWFQYYRKRWLTTVAAFTRTVPQLQGVKVGYRTINGNSYIGVQPINLSGTDETQTLIQKIKNFHPDGKQGSTPLREGLDMVGLYFHMTATTGKLEEDLEISPISTDAGGACQQNFAIIISDGAWDGGAAGYGNIDEDQGEPYADEWPNTLADTAMYFYMNDLAPAVADEVPTNFYDKATWQHMVTYGVTFGVNGHLDPDDYDLFNIDPDQRVYPAWLSPLGSDDSALKAKIDDIYHAAVNGRGKYLSAKTPQELIAFLKEAIDDVVARIGSGAGVTINGEEIDAGSTVYQSIYNTEGWTGDVRAYALNPDTGEVIRSSYLWSAEEQLKDQNWDTGRKIATFNGTLGIPFRYDASQTDLFDLLNTDLTQAQNMVNYLRGDSSLEVKNGGTYRNRNFKINELTTRDTKLGDIVHSAPVFHSYVKDSTTHKMIYAGANDGMLHAFNADTGQEVFAYVPRLVFGHLKSLTDPNYNHEFFVDLTPYVASVVKDGVRLSYLVGGLGKGGRGYYSLDVTDPLGIASEQDLAGKVLWEYPENDLIITGASNNPGSAIVITTSGDHGLITGDLVEISGVEGNTAANGFHKITVVSNTTFSLLNAEGSNPTEGNGEWTRGGVLCSDRDLGYSYSRAFTVNSNLPKDVSGNDRWVTIFGNGYNSASLKAVLYVLDAHDGTVIKKIDTGFGGPEGSCNGLSTPLLADVNNDEGVDYVYAGDLQGNMWKFDLTSADINNWGVAYADNDGKPMPLFVAKDANNKVQPITSMPDVMRPLYPGQPGYIVVFGTGKYLGPRDFSNTQVQTIYGIWDYGDDDDASEYLGVAVRGSDADGNATLTLSNQSPFSSLARQTKLLDVNFAGQSLRVLSDNPVNYLWETDTGGEENPSTTEANHVGWYFDLPDTKERVVQDVLIRSGKAIVISNIPNTNPCAAGGSSWMYEINANTGGRLKAPQFDINNDNVIDENDLIKIENPAWSSGDDPADQYLYLAPTGIWFPTMVFTPTIMGMGEEEIKLMSTAAGSIIDLMETGEERGMVYWRQID